MAAFGNVIRTLAVRSVPGMKGPDRARSELTNAAVILLLTCVCRIYKLWIISSKDVPQAKLIFVDTKREVMSRW